MTVWSRFVRMLDTDEDGRSLAVVRILVGLSVLAAMLEVVLPGALPVIWFDVSHGGYRPLGEGTPLVANLGGPTPGVVWGLATLTMLSGAALALGAFGRLSAFLALQGFLGVAWLNGHTAGSYDFVVTNALWLLVLAQADATGGIRARLATGAWWPRVAVPAWPRWLMVVQLVLMYTSTGLQKVSAHWVPGGDMTALYYIMQQPSWQRMDLSAAAWMLPLSQAATLGSWLWEVSAPLLLLAFWFRRTRTRGGWLRATFNRLDVRLVFAVFGAIMHAGIHTLMDVGPFSYLTLALYPALFSPEELGTRWFARRGLPLLWGALVLSGLLAS
ncbi:MAG: HTTM domain-containing protein [Myxococcota bacterium]|nr:HTTM domain-containing protein [Myxococcota bacterium]MEC8422137.1 HTTM domain-containing protein [Myxococcota bacterium]